MNKQTLYAVIISTIIIIVGFSIQRIIVDRQAQDQQSEQTPADQESPSDPAAPSAGESGAIAARTGGIVPVIDDGRSLSCDPQFNNGTVEVTFSAVTASIESFKLLKHLEDNRPIDMVFRGSGTRNPFTILVGGDDGYELQGAYSCRSRSDSIEFTGRFVAPAVQQQPFDVTVTYTFVPDEYLFQQDIAFRNSINRSVPLSDSGNGSYTLYIGPQIGPEFEKLDNRAEYRKYVTLEGRDKNTERLNGRRTDTLTAPRNAKWAAIVGKYFTLVAIPHAGVERIFVSAVEKEGVPAASEMYLNRAPIQSSSQTDTYRFYFGPKQRKELIKYDREEDNALGIAGMSLKKVQDSRPLLGWLEAILKLLLTFFYAVIPNYGIAIIFLTIVVKIALTPLTRKSQQSMEHMQALSPKISELREQYANDKQRLNVEMAQLYKRERVNPAGGCLPLLLQMPFFLAMFGLFNNHFELRDAVFIMGWIDDLSMPESILNFGDFTLPLLGWNDLRLLPILYAGSQLLSGYISRNPGQTAQQNKMTLLMPVVLFFVLYNLPAGLLVYWVVTNLLTTAQQMATRARRKRAVQ